MKKTTLLFALVLSAASCMSLDQQDERRLIVGVGLQEITVGDMDSGRQPVMLVEIETARDPQVGVRGVIGVTAATGRAKDVDVPEQGTFDLDMNTVSAHAGLRYRPADWGYTVTPFVGAGLAYLDLEAQGPEATKSASSLGMYTEAGIGWRNLALSYRRIDGLEFDLGEGLEEESGDVEALLLSWSIQF